MMYMYREQILEEMEIMTAAEEDRDELITIRALSKTIDFTEENIA